MNHRVESARPTAALNVNIAFRIAAGGERPNHVVDARRIDVIIDDDCETVLIAAGKTLRRDHPGLLGVTGIALFDRDHGKLPRSRLVRPDAADVRHPGFFQLLPDVRRARDRAQQGERVRWARRIGAGENRIVAMQYALDADKRLEAPRAGVVTR